MKTDSIFYEIFQSDPSILCELIDNPDPRVSAYSFASQEVKQTSFRFDGILMPPLRMQDLPIVFVEAQAYRDKVGTLYSSFFSQIFLYLHDYQPRNDWQSVLIFTRRSLDPGLPIQYQDFEASPRFKRIYLDELGEADDLSLNMKLLKLIGEPKSSASSLGQRLVETAKVEIEDAKQLENFVELIATTLVYKYSELSRSEIEAMLQVSALRNTRVFQEAKEEGIEEGIEKGRAEGRADAIPLMLEAGVSLEQMAQRWELELSEVENMAISALKRVNTPEKMIAERLNISLDRAQTVMDRKGD